MTRLARGGAGTDVLVVVLAVRCAWDCRLGDYVWQVRWLLLALGRPTILMRVSKLPLEHDTSRWRGPEEQVATARDLLPDWVLFSARLAPEQREVLRGIATLSDPSAALREIADSYGSMPHLLIDSINELALDTLGDYIIVPDSDPPVLRNEDLEAVDRIIALWANRPEIPG